MFSWSFDQEWNWIHQRVRRILNENVQEKFSFMYVNHKSKIFVDSQQSSLFADFLDDKQQWDSRPRWTPVRRGYYYCSRGENFHLLHWLLPRQPTLTYPTGSKWLYLYINAYIFVIIITCMIATDRHLRLSRSNDP